MEYMRHGCLKDVLEHRRLSRPEIYSILLQILQAVFFLHESNYAHRDIKPANILVDSASPLLVKLADFSCAKSTGDGEPELHSVAGSGVYAAPEASIDWRESDKTKPGKPYTAKVDIWSVGVVIWKCAFGFPDFDGAGDSQTRLAYHAQRNITDDLSHFLALDMLRLDESDRLSAKDCLSKAQALVQAAKRGTEGSMSQNSQHTQRSADTMRNPERSAKQDAIPATTPSQFAVRNARSTVVSREMDDGSSKAEAQDAEQTTSHQKSLVSKAVPDRSVVTTGSQMSETTPSGSSMSISPDKRPSSNVGASEATSNVNSKEPVRPAVAPPTDTKHRVADSAASSKDVSKRPRVSSPASQLSTSREKPKQPRRRKDDDDR